MIIIKHRQNTYDEIQSLNRIYGAEIDLRCDSGDIYVSHDIYNQDVLFEKWLDYYEHAFLIANIKEEGIEDIVLKMLDKKNITDFFLLDQSFPNIMRYINNGFTKSCIRISDYEPIDTALKLHKNINWVWLDSFKIFNFTSNDINKLKSLNIKICLVSPELHQDFFKIDLKSLFKILIERDVKIDAVCTKFESEWENFRYA